MSVVTDIAKSVIGAGERGFRTNHPILAEQLTNPGSECFWVSEKLQLAMQAEIVVCIGLLDAGNERAAKDRPKTLTGRKNE
jgi:hypothetical protein